MRKLLVVCFVLVLVSLATLITSCGGESEYASVGGSQFFVQDYNPEYLDILWVMDDRSPMNKARANIEAEARKFFDKLEATTGDYRMAFITADMTYAKGQLQPIGRPEVILKQKIGSVTERVARFSTAISNVINLRTGGENHGLESALTALQKHFVPRKGVPLVLIFISDSYDKSALPAGQTSIAEYYQNEFLKLKDGNAEQLRVYAANYVPLENGEVASNPPLTKRCTTNQYNAEIDSYPKSADGTPTVQNPFFIVSGKSGGDTGNLCTAFADQIDLSGLRLKTLPNSFMLEKTPDRPDSISVVMTRKGEEVASVPWSYDAGTNSIVFSQTPPEGVTIQVVYH